ncbi:MAG: helix-turn-helix transcriptional regulator [Pseudonocardiaceae bacterium]
MAEKHLTIEQLSERLSVPVTTIYQWNSKGTGPKCLRVGRFVRYRIADVLAWEKTRARGKTPIS